MKTRFLLLILLSVFIFIPSEAFERKKNVRKVRYELTEPYFIEPDAVAEKAAADPGLHSAVATNPYNVKEIHKIYIEGADVSHYQGHIDWKKLAESNEISYVYLKATEGASLVDDTYHRNLREARKSGIKVGSYHFYRPNVKWQEQYKNLVSVVKKGKQDLVPIIDVEYRGRCSQAKFISDLKAFLSKVTKHYGKKPMLYTYNNFYNKHLSGALKGYQWMIARYQEDEPRLNDGTEYVMWQYTQSGSLPGIEGGVDRSRVMDESLLKEVEF